MIQKKLSPTTHSSIRTASNFFSRSVSTFHSRPAVNRNGALPKADQCSLTYKPAVLLRLTGAIVAVLLTFTAVYTIHRWHGERQLREKLFLKEGDAVFKAIISPPQNLLICCTSLSLCFTFLRTWMHLARLESLHRPTFLMLLLRQSYQAQS
jgi:hypothetical protein